MARPEAAYYHNTIHHYRLNRHQQALADAIEGMSLEDVRTILQSGKVDLAKPISDQGMTFLQHAVACGSAQFVNLLLEAGAEPDQADKHGNTPLHYCAYAHGGGGTVLAMSLVRRGAGINHQNHKGKTPLHIAADMGHERFSLMLLDLGADSDITDKDGLTASSHNAVITSAIRMNQSPPLPDWSQPLGKAELLAQSKNGLSMLDAGATWARGRVWLEQLDKAGEHLTREELLHKGKNGKTYLERAIQKRVAGAVLERLYANGERLEAGDLVHRGKPTAVLKALTECKQLRAVFCTEAWKHQDINDLGQVYAALPPEGKNQVTNYPRLRIEMTRDNNITEQGRGR